MLQAGDRVLIRVPLNELTASRKIKSFNGKVATVKCTATRGTSKYGNAKTYILEGIEGQCGQPFQFFEEWLIPINREV